MKKHRLFSILIIILTAVMSASACSAYDPSGGRGYFETGISGNEFHEITENPFVLTSENNLSFFSLDTSTASYTQVRKYINNGYTINKNMVRTEEMINYFKYDFARPEEQEALKISGYVTDCPWNNDSKLVTVGVASKDIVRSSIRNNLVFLIDVSGSMYDNDKLPLLQSSFTLLTEALNPDDVISIVTYAGTDAIRLEGAPGGEKLMIDAIVSDLTAGGSTAGADGINTAYQIAQRYFITDGNNRVILATDGDFNVGAGSTKDLEDLISEKRDTGIYLTVMGFGYGNLKDNKMKSLAQKGNGNYFYIDSYTEARRALAESVNGTLVTVARDAKAQVEFNKDSIESYRLLGYENQLLTQEDWENDQADAGEIGAGLCVAAVYEIKLKNNAAGDFLTASIRYKNPDKNDSIEREISLDIGETHFYTDMPGDITFISCVAEFALILFNSAHKAGANLNNVIARLQTLENLSDDVYKEEFLTLVQKYKTNTGA